jgi:hypothetical protein
LRTPPRPSELESRLTTERERTLLAQAGLLPSPPPADMVIYRRAEILRLLYDLYPRLWERYARARDSGFQGPEAAIPDATTIPLIHDQETVRHKMSSAAAQAAQFNADLAAARTAGPRATWYDPITQVFQFPRLRTTAPPAQKNPPVSRAALYPVALLPGQFSAVSVPVHGSAQTAAFLADSLGRHPASIQVPCFPCLFAIKPSRK